LPTSSIPKCAHAWNGSVVVSKPVGLVFSP
jgi:hypothetical protein